MTATALEAIRVQRRAAVNAKIDELRTITANLRSLEWWADGADQMLKRGAVLCVELCRRFKPPIARYFGRPPATTRSPTITPAIKRPHAYVTGQWMQQLREYRTA